MLVLVGRSGDVVQNEIQNKGTAHTKKNRHRVPPCPWEMDARDSQISCSPMLRGCRATERKRPRRSTSSPANSVPMARNCVSVPFRTSRSLGKFDASLCGSAEKPIRKTKRIDRAFDGQEPTLVTVERAFETVTDHDSRLQSRIKLRTSVAAGSGGFSPQQLAAECDHSFYLSNRR